MITNLDIRKFLGLPTEGIKRIYIDGVDDLYSDSSNTLKFINKSGLSLDSLDRFTFYEVVYLVDNRYYDEIESSHNDFILVDNPKYQFARIVKEFGLISKFENYHPAPEGLCYVEQGDNCEIDSTAIIGGVDFSPVLGDSRYDLIQFPQMGGVRLGNNVVVKYNTMIGKGTFGFTDIGDSTMIDYGCQIGHNCKIGKACIIAAGTIIGGSTTVGDCCTIGIGAKIRNGIHIGQNVSIGMGAVVIKDIPDNCTVVGNPARIIEHDHIFNERGLV